MRCIILWNVLRCPSGPGSFYFTEVIMEEKVFKTLDELVNLLIKRGIKIDNPSDYDYAKRVLEKNGYYNLINGYNKLFLLDAPDVNNPDITYRANTTLYEIHALYQFDRVLRNIFFRYILEVEVNVKSLISYYFSEAHGHKNYLIYTNFNTALRNSESKITELIAEIQRQVAGRSSDPSISHYLNAHGYIPLWVLNNILTLGTISKFYSLMLPQERQSVSRNFGMMDNELENALQYISTIRNFCAHGNRLYCFRTKKPLSSTTYHSALNIRQNSNGEYVQGKRDLFAGMIALKRLLSHNDYKRMSKEIYRAIGTLEKKLNVLTIDEILNEMGFPANWRELNSL
ncbi:Abi family protein [Coprococcus comes]|uniref:Abi family protein n=2 Tax=Coprococcus comes TaxID=410072 RepID=A0A3E4GMG8_9FIRM|nr:Abi family protein [Coprococcus comes]